MNVEGKRPRGRPRLRWNETIRMDMKGGRSGRNGPLTGRKGKISTRPATPHREMAANGEKDQRSSEKDHPCTITLHFTMFCIDL